MLPETSGAFLDVCEHPTEIPATSSASDAAHRLRVFEWNIFSSTSMVPSRFGTTPECGKTNHPGAPRVSHADGFYRPPGKQNVRSSCVFTGKICMYPVPMGNGPIFKCGGGVYGPTIALWPYRRTKQLCPVSGVPPC